MEDRSTTLGRGFSLTTNSFQSTCLNVNQTVDSSSYDYNYYYTDFTSKTDLESIIDKISKSFGYGEVKAAVNQALAKSNNITQHHVIAVTLRVERYFSTVEEKNASISQSALQMLHGHNFIDFFITCGPAYVRSLHRAQEITAIFKFETAFPSSAQIFSDWLKLILYGDHMDISNSRKKTHENPDSSDDFIEHILRSLSIELIGYGISLNKNGKERLVVTNIFDFNEMMKFAFDSMTKSDNTANEDAMIYQMDVVPWTDNAEFLVSANMHKNAIILPTPIGLIESSKEVITINNEGEQENRRVCRWTESVIDDVGKCCDEDDMVVLPRRNNKSKKICKPLRHLPTTLMRDNMESNSEFVVWLDSVAKEKMKVITTIKQCLMKLRSFPERFDYIYLESRARGQVSYDPSIEMNFTVKELKLALDPTHDLEIISLLKNEREEYVQMFYQPCISALYGQNMGHNSDTDPQLFMAETWYNHEECMRLSCLERNMAWDRRNGNGCIQGILSRGYDESNNMIPSSTDANCAAQVDAVSGEKSCNFISNEKFLRQMNTCRRNLPQGRDGRGRPIPLSIDYLVGHFCMPKLSILREEADDDRKCKIDHICEEKIREPPSDQKGQENSYNGGNGSTTQPSQPVTTPPIDENTCEEDGTCTSSDIGLPPLVPITKENVYQQIWDADQNGNGIPAILPADTVTSRDKGYVIVNETPNFNSDTKVFPEVVIPENKLSTYTKFKDLIDNYFIDSDEKEDAFNTIEMNEIDTFIEAIYNTQPMKIAREYLDPSQSDEDWKNSIKEKWFTSFAVGTNDRSGFEHVFVGENSRSRSSNNIGNNIGGYHFWYKYYIDDSGQGNINGKDTIDYLGAAYDWGRKNTEGRKVPEVVTLNFKWTPEDEATKEKFDLEKPIAGFWVGCSPEGLIALGMARFKEATKGATDIVINNVEYKLKLVTNIDRHNGRNRGRTDDKFINIFYPIFNRIIDD